MKSLIKFLANTNLGILIRNSLNIKPLSIKLTNPKKAISISDAFHWRTDSGFKTKFKFSDILKLFYKVENSWVEIHFYSKINQLIKIHKIDNLDLSNELEINSKFLNDINDYGVFYIYHLSKDEIDKKNMISNKCYLGYSLNNGLYSHVHGNTYAKHTNINGSGKIYTNMVKTSLFKNQKYTIQKYFSGFDKNELFFSNPTSKILRFSLEDKDYKLNPGCSKIVRTYKSIITIKSNCLFLRPTVFSYQKQFFDVHHS